MLKIIATVSPCYIQVMSHLARLTNTGRTPYEENSLYTYEIVKHDEKNKGSQAAVSAALKVTRTVLTSSAYCMVSPSFAEQPLFDYGILRMSCAPLNSVTRESVKDVRGKAFDSYPKMPQLQNWDPVSKRASCCMAADIQVSFRPPEDGGST